MEKKRVILGLIVSLYFILSIVVDAEVFKFDMGDEKSPVYSGFIKVTKETTYTEEKGYGWTGSSKNLKDGYWKLPDDLAMDYVSGSPAIFKVNIPNGEYKVCYISPHCNYSNAYYTPGFRYDARWYVKVKGKEVSRLDFNDYMKDVFFKNIDNDYHKNDSIWKKYIRNEFIPRYFIIEVKDNTIEIEFTNGCCITCLVIYPLEKAEQVEKELVEIEKEREKKFNLGIEEIKNEEEKGPFYSISENDRKTGYIIFSRNYLDEIRYNSRPKEGEVKKELTAFASGDEYEPFTFSLFPLIDLKKVKIEVTELENNKGNKIGKENISLNIVRYIEISKGKFGYFQYPIKYEVFPFYLREYKESDFEEGVSRRFWLTVKVPKDTPEGIYKGKITISPEGNPSSSLEIKLRVLPFNLQPFEDIFIRTAFQDLRYGSSDFDKYMELIKSYLIFIKEYGLTPDTQSLPNRLFGQKIDEKTRCVDLTYYKKYLEYYKEIGFPSKEVVLCLYSPILKNWWGIPGGTKTRQGYYYNQEGREIIKEILLNIKGETNKFGLEPIFLIGGELTNAGIELIRGYIPLYKELKEAGLKLYNNSNGQGEVDLLSPYLYIHGLRDYLMTPENISYIKKVAPDCKYWIYGVETRFKAGFGYCRSGAKGSYTEFLVIPRRDPYNPFDVGWEGLHISFCLPGEEKPVSTLKAERIREGIDDTRYIRMLESLIKEGEKKKIDVTESKKILEEIMDYINPDFSYYYTHSAPSNEVYDKLRWRIANEIIKLNKILK
ncbi:MAG TPA: DUF6067 family protein [bacterium]|nr:DUF6067 family protein [bacterium]